MAETEPEKTAREAFYKNLHSVVDGTRLPNDFKRFLGEIPNWLTLPMQKRFKFASPDEWLPKAWISRPVPVIFDWGAGNDLLWLDPRQGYYSIQLGFKLNREAFVAYIQSSDLKPLNSYTLIYHCTLHSQQCNKDDQAQFAAVEPFNYASMTSFTECFQAPVIIGQRR